MWNIIICDGNEEEQRQLIALVHHYCTKRGLEAHIQGCQDWPGLAEKIKEHEPDTVIVAQNGVEGLDTITSLKLVTGKIIWFSDLDFGVQAYRLCISYFCKKPVTYRKIESALEEKFKSVS